MRFWLRPGDSTAPWTDQINIAAGLRSAWLWQDGRPQKPIGSGCSTWRRRGLSWRSVPKETLKPVLGMKHRRDQATSQKPVRLGPHHLGCPPVLFGPAGEEK